MGDSLYTIITLPRRHYQHQQSVCYLFAKESMANCISCPFPLSPFPPSSSLHRPRRRIRPVFFCSILMCIVHKAKIRVYYQAKRRGINFCLFQFFGIPKTDLEWRCAHGWERSDKECPNPLSAWFDCVHAPNKKRMHADRNM